MDNNNIHSPNTASESRPSALKTLPPFFLRCMACQSIRGNCTGTFNTHTRVYPHWYPLGKSGVGEPYHSDSRKGNGTEFRNGSPLGDRVGRFGTF